MTKTQVLVRYWRSFVVFEVVEVAKMAFARHIPLFWNDQAAIFHIVMTFSEVKNTKRIFIVENTNLFHEIIFADRMRSQFMGQKFEHIIFTTASRSWRIGRHFDGLIFEGFNLFRVKIDHKTAYLTATSPEYNKSQGKTQTWPVSIGVAGDEVLLAARRTYYYSYSGKSQLHYDMGGSILTTKWVRTGDPPQNLISYSLCNIQSDPSLLNRSTEH